MESSTNYTNKDFTNETELPEILEKSHFVKCNFSSLSFANTQLKGCVFDNCRFDFTKICGNIEKCAFLNCSFRFADLLGTHFISCKMTGSDLSVLSDAGFSIDGGDWSYTMLSKVHLKKLDLSNINFTGSNIFDCKFENCKLNGTKFDNSFINKLSLKGSDIRETSFNMVNLAQIDFKDCIADLDFCIHFARAAGIKIK